MAQAFISFGSCPKLLLVWLQGQAHPSQETWQIPGLAAGQKSKASYWMKPYYLYKYIFFITDFSHDQPEKRTGSGHSCCFHFACVDLCGHPSAYICLHCVSVCMCAQGKHVLVLTTGWTWRHGAAAASPLMEYRVWQLLTVPTHKTTTLFPILYSKSRFTGLNIYLDRKEKYFEELEIDTTDFLRDKQLLCGQLRTKPMSQIQRGVQSKMEKKCIESFAEVEMQQKKKVLHFTKQ